MCLGRLLVDLSRPGGSGTTSDSGLHSRPRAADRNDQAQRERTQPYRTNEIRNLF
jgi:hypothetical protein